MSRRVFVGFGFGPIQSGLFLYEAFRSGRFDRLVVAEVLPEIVTAIRQDGGYYRLNVATRTGLERHEVSGVEIFNPLDPRDRSALTAAVAEATELATALPSVDFFTRGETSVAHILADGFRQKTTPAVVYTGENNNHAAEILEAAVGRRATVQFLNTVIGKMSGVVTDAAEIAAQNLATFTDTLPRAFLVEEFNRILITQITLPAFQRGITVFEEKPDLLPFEEAKLYGHNAVHALLGYRAHQLGCRFMSELTADRALVRWGREAFLEEAGPGLLARHAGFDPLFAPAGFAAYADDLLERMTNPFLRDSVARIIRDPRRKLGWNDRLVGPIRLALDAGVTPRRFARAAAAAFALLRAEQPGVTLESLWPEPDEPAGRKRLVKTLMEAAAA